ncbi:uncharacterized protein LOC108032332 [Drosophila biarmipes]|uniref:uncharacterized protein LOC108032332 n=1 Tax=Drosophila biarmipes TaxID=125945 RepID=UPI0007E7B39F|nr:uncharacterized protein LOC108032332 [Drosophila biarmipes]
MLFLRTIFFFALLAFVRTSPAERKNAAICEFFKHVKTFQDDQWEDSVILMKGLLEEMIAALQPYPEYADYKDSMQAYLDRGKTIVSSSSLQEKMAYFRGFNEDGGQPMLTGSPAKKEELTRPLRNFQSKMILNVLTEFHQKLIKAAGDMERVVRLSGDSLEGELFRLLEQYRSEGLGRLTENIASRILALKGQYNCV